VRGRGKEVRAPLFDRLIGREPDGGRASGHRRTLDRTGLRESVRRELGRLFDTRCPLPADALRGRERTVIEYGLPDLSVLAPENHADRLRLAAILREAIEAYEPRLADVRVTVATPSPSPGRRQALRARIDAVLVVDDVAESVSFGAHLAEHGAAVTVE
jgi:type VI secretion system lysozyme-like protein